MSLRRGGNTRAYWDSARIRKPCADSCGAVPPSNCEPTRDACATCAATRGASARASPAGPTPSVNFLDRLVAGKSGALQIRLHLVQRAVGERAHQDAIEFRLFRNLHGDRLEVFLMQHVDHDVGLGFRGRDEL